MLTSYPIVAQTTNARSARQQKVVALILKQLDYQEKMTIAQDTAAMKRYYPDDIRITNPFNMLIDKSVF